MRDPKRIKPFLKELEKYWNTVPDWRFGQLIDNWFDFLGSRDPFFPEEDEMLIALRKMFEELNMK